MENQNLVNFQNLLHNVSKSMSKQQLLRLKYSLAGHMDQHLIAEIEEPTELIFYLLYNKLMGLQKIAFFRKLLGDVGDADDLISMIDEYIEMKAEYKEKKKQEMAKAKQESKELLIIKQRQSTILKDNQDLLDRHTLTLKELVSSKDGLLNEIAQLTMQSGCLRETKADKLSKYRQAQSELLTHEQQMVDVKQQLFKLKENCEEMKNKRDELSVTLTLKGELRLNAFQKILKKEEIAATERSIQDVRRLIIEQKQRVMELDDESDVAVGKVDVRREKLRAVFADVKTVFLEENQLHEQLDAVDEKILEIKDRIGDCRQHFLEIEMDMEKSEKSFEKCRSVLQNVATTDNRTNDHNNNNISSNDNDNKGFRMLRNISEENSGKLSSDFIDYETFGSYITSLGVDENINSSINRNQTKEKKKILKLNHPFCVTVDRNKDIVVIDSSPGTTYYRLINFTFKGETNFHVPLRPMRPVDMTVDSHNNYFVAGNTLVKKYRRTEVVLQFVPHYHANTMQLPQISSIEFNYARGDLFLLDKANVCIQVYDGESGQYQAIIDLSETVITPSKLHIQNKESLIVTDQGADSVVLCRFHKNSIVHSKVIGCRGIGHGEFVSPTSLTTDRCGNILVCDSGNHRVCILHGSGDYRTCIGQLGEGLRSFKSPVDLCLHSSDDREQGGVMKMLVADKLNDRILVILR